MSPSASWGSVPLGTWHKTRESLDFTKQGERQGDKHETHEELFNMVEELQAGLNVAENITAQGRQQRRWCMLPSVGTWMMPPVFKEAQEKPMSVAEPAVDEAELSMREAAFDFFWAQVDEEEEDERAFFMESELSLRQAALDFFWAQVDQEEEDERALYMESELSLRQAALDFFWAQVDEEEKDSKVVRRKVAQSPQLHVDMIAQDAEERPTFSMAGSPAKSIRLAKLSVSLGIDAPFSLCSSPWQSVTRKSSGTKKRSSSTSAMAIDLGDSKAKSGIDYLSGHAQVVSISKEHIPMLSGKKGELPPLKKAKMCVKVPSPHLPRGC